MFGILKVGYKLLVNDRAKFSALLVGITFAVFLMIEITSLFSGILQRSSATVINIGAKVWVMDPAVQTVANSIPLPDYILDEVRSIAGVKYAVPLYSGAGLVKLGSGAFQGVTILGLDDSSLFGRPALLEGNIENIFAENGFLAVKDAEFAKLENPTIGTTFEINDHRGVIVGIAKVASGGLFGVPTLYTTYNRALQYIPNSRFTISYILVEPKTAADVRFIQQQVARAGYVALTEEEFIQKITKFYIYQTGFGTNMLLMTIISFVVGLSISGQTFYTFILENLDKFGALKAIGAKSYELIAIILFQATFMALAGYGLGIGLCALSITLAKLRLPDYAAVITYTNLLLALVMVVLIAGLSSYVGVRKVLTIEPFDIFQRLIMAKTAIHAAGLTKWFGTGDIKTYAVRDASFETYFGEIVFVVGPSGSGKTTLLSIVSGILRPDAGTVTVEGTDIWRLGTDQNAEFRLHKLGFVFQDYHLFPRLTTAENVAIPLILQRRPWQQAMDEAVRYLEIVGLKDRVHLAPVKLSGGEQQRVAIARAMVSQPDVLIFDEPTASLDGDTGRTILRFVKEHILTDTRSIVIVTHDDRIFEFADRILRMEDGRLTGVEKGKHS